MISSRRAVEELNIVRGECDGRHGECRGDRCQGDSRGAPAEDPSGSIAVQDFRKGSQLAIPTLHEVLPVESCAARRSASLGTRESFACPCCLTNCGKATGY